MSFEEAQRRVEEELRGARLQILVWGPGTGGGEHYDKRLKVRDELGAQFPLADVRFSEVCTGSGEVPHLSSQVSPLRRGPVAEQWPAPYVDLLLGAANIHSDGQAGHREGG